MARSARLLLAVAIALAGALGAVWFLRREGEIARSCATSPDSTAAQRPTQSDDESRGADREASGAEPIRHPEDDPRPRAVDASHGPQLRVVDSDAQRDLDGIEVRFDSTVGDGRPFRIGVGAEDVFLTNASSPLDLAPISRDRRAGSLWLGAPGRAWRRANAATAIIGGTVELGPGHDLTLVFDHYSTPRVVTDDADDAEARLARTLRPLAHLTPIGFGEPLQFPVDAPVIELRGLPCSWYRVRVDIAGGAAGSRTIASGLADFSSSRSATLTLDLARLAELETSLDASPVDVTVRVVDAATREELRVSELLWSVPPLATQTSVSAADGEPLRFRVSARHVRLALEAPPRRDGADLVLYRPHDEEHELAAGENLVTIPLVRRNALLLKLARRAQPDVILMLHGVVEPAEWIKSRHGEPFTLEAAVLALGGVLFDVDPPGSYSIDIPASQSERTEPLQVEIPNARVLERVVLVDQRE